MTGEGRDDAERNELACLTALKPNRPCDGDERRVQRRADPADGTAGRAHDAAGFPVRDFVKGGAVGGGGGEDGAEEGGAVGGAGDGGEGAEEVGDGGVVFECGAQEVRGGGDALWWGNCGWCWG